MTRDMRQLHVVVVPLSAVACTNGFASRPSKMASRAMGGYDAGISLLQS